MKYILLFLLLLPFQLLAQNDNENSKVRHDTICYYYNKEDTLCHARVFRKKYDSYIFGKVWHMSTVGFITFPIKEIRDTSSLKKYRKVSSKEIIKIGKEDMTKKLPNGTSIVFKLLIIRKGDENFIVNRTSKLIMQWEE